MITGNPSTLKMHMTGMESFNVTSKRGGAGGSIPMTQTTGTSNGGGPGSAITGADSQSQVIADSRTINTNKSNM